MIRLAEMERYSENRYGLGVKTGWGFDPVSQREWTNTAVSDRHGPLPAPRSAGGG
jgi:hypothetical protein